MATIRERGSRGQRRSLQVHECGRLRRCDMFPQRAAVPRPRPPLSTQLVSRSSGYSGRGTTREDRHFRRRNRRQRESKPAPDATVNLLTSATDIEMSRKKKRRTGRQRRLRLKLFDAGNTRCPICLSEFTRSDVVLGKATLEHAPPKALQGSAICLTCSDCNNQASLIDQHAILAKRATDDWTSGKGTRVEIDFLGVKKTSRYIPSDPNTPPPTRIDHLRKGSMTIGPFSESEFLEAEKGISFRIPRRPRYEWIAMIKSAYLMVFSLMGDAGYNYCNSPALRSVREQIMNPGKRILSGLFVIDGTMPVTDQTDGRIVFLWFLAVSSG